MHVGSAGATNCDPHAPSATRRRGDRIAALTHLHLLHLLTTGFGTKWTSQDVGPFVRFRATADMRRPRVVINRSRMTRSGL
jgi:hypothetical protein